jgi:hypothetical protein
MHLFMPNHFTQGYGAVLTTGIKYLTTGIMKVDSPEFFRSWINVSTTPRIPGLNSFLWRSKSFRFNHYEYLLCSRTDPAAPDMLLYCNSAA